MQTYMEQTKQQINYRRLMLFPFESKLLLAFDWFGKNTRVMVRAFFVVVFFFFVFIRLHHYHRFMLFTLCNKYMSRFWRKRQCVRRRQKRNPYTPTFAFIHKSKQTKIWMVFRCVVKNKREGDQETEIFAESEWNTRKYVLNRMTWILISILLLCGASSLSALRNVCGFE